MIRSATLLSILFLATTPTLADLPNDPLTAWDQAAPELTRVASATISEVVNGFRTSGNKPLNPAMTMEFVEGHLTVALVEYNPNRRFDSYTLAFEDLQKGLLDYIRDNMDRSKELKKIDPKIERWNGVCFAVALKLMRIMPLYIELHYPKLLIEQNPQLELKVILLAALDHSAEFTAFAADSTTGIRQADLIKREQRLRRRDRALNRQEEMLMAWENRLMEKETWLGHQERLIAKENDLIRREKSLQRREVKLEKPKKKATNKG